LNYYFFHYSLFPLSLLFTELNLQLSIVLLQLQIIAIIILPSFLLTLPANHRLVRRHQHNLACSSSPLCWLTFLTCFVCSLSISLSPLFSCLSVSLSYCLSVFLSSRLLQQLITEAKSVKKSYNLQTPVKITSQA